MDSAGDTIKDMSTGEASTPFVRGAGHVDPNCALDPGLVYDTGTDDYISFLCALGYTAEQIAVLTRDGSVTDCSTRSGSVGDLNCPAFSVVFGSGDGKVTQRRVVRSAKATYTQVYTATVTSPAGVHVAVEPPTLQFSATQQTQDRVRDHLRAAAGRRDREVHVRVHRVE
ncbi:subtilisin-like protease SBT1.7 [Panicum miliaceum]|uniref:Subtilisin-like protease SBT1.7 n=1 Tax=Panicum miliaceum TaxID=4540 RepID=A0A3L6RPH4_PANMI|nr:subtilisin-like protease SBT1.7 [Panicum miliaceum]